MSGETLAEQLATALPELPDGDYAIVEINGHRTLVGKIDEVMRFGSTMLQITPILRGQFLEPVLANASSIYMLTPCTKEKAIKNAPRHDHQLPRPVLCAMPVDRLETPPPRDGEDDGPEPEFEPAFLTREDR